MENKKRQYTQEFKKEVVEYSLASDKTVKEIARDLGISCHNLDRWRTQYRKRGELTADIIQAPSYDTSSRKKASKL